MVERFEEARVRELAVHGERVAEDEGEGDEREEEAAGERVSLSERECELRRDVEHVQGARLKLRSTERAEMASQGGSAACTNFVARRLWDLGGQSGERIESGLFQSFVSIPAACFQTGNNVGSSVQ